MNTYIESVRLLSSTSLLIALFTVFAVEFIIDTEMPDPKKSLDYVPAAKKFVPKHRSISFFLSTLFRIIFCHNFAKILTILG